MPYHMPLALHISRCLSRARVCQPRNGQATQILRLRNGQRPNFEAAHSKQSLPAGRESDAPHRMPRDAYAWVREGSFLNSTTKPSGMKPLARPARLGRQNRSTSRALRTCIDLPRIAIRTPSSYNTAPCTKRNQPQGKLLASSSKPTPHHKHAAQGQRQG